MDTWRLRLPSSVISLNYNSLSFYLNGSEKPLLSFRLDGKQQYQTRTGKLCSFNECLIHFGPHVCRRPDGTFLQDCSFRTSSITVLLSLARSSCGGTAIVRAGPSMASETGSARRRPSSPILQLMANTGSFKQCFSLVWWSLSARIFSYAKQIGYDISWLHHHAALLNWGFFEANDESLDCLLCLFLMSKHLLGR